MNIKKRQDGMALILVLVLLVVGTLLSVSNYRSANLEERMSASQRFSIAAFQAAEAGILDVVSSLRANYTPDSPIVCESGAVGVGDALPASQAVNFSASEALSGSYTYWMECEGDQLVGYSRGEIDMGEGMPAVSRVVKLLLQPPGEGVNTDVYYGIKAQGDIVLRGQNVINGSIHTNSNLTINNIDGEAVGAISATGTVTSNDLEVVGPDGGECESAVCAIAGADELVIESASLKIGEITSAVDEAGQYSSGGEVVDFVDLIATTGSCDITLDGDMGGDIYYCSDPDVVFDVSGSFNNVTLMAQGDIRNDGQSNLGEYDSNKEGPDTIDTQIIAGGDILMNGNDDSYAVYWADGNVVQNGTSVLYGSIIAGGTVTRNGGINFSFWESYTGVTIERVRRFGNILYWVELESA